MKEWVAIRVMVSDRGIDFHSMGDYEVVKKEDLNEQMDMMKLSLCESEYYSIKYVEYDSITQRVFK